jgi:hypothetical protein
LGFGQVGFTALQLLSHLHLLSNIHPCPKETLESPSLRDRNTHAAHATNLSIWPHNPFREVECAMVDQHRRNSLFHEGAIFRVYKSQIFFYSWRLATRIKTIDPKQLGGPVLESSCIERPTSHVGKALPLSKIKLALLKRLLGALAVLDVDAGSMPLDDVSQFVPHGDFVVQHPAILTVSAPYACFVQERLTASQGRAPLLNDPFDIVGMNVLGPSPTQQIFQRPTHVVEPTLIEEVEVSVRQTGVNQGGGGVDQEPKVRSLACPLITKRLPRSHARNFRRAHVSLTDRTLRLGSANFITVRCGRSQRRCKSRRTRPVKISNPQTPLFTANRLSVR